MPSSTRVFSSIASAVACVCAAQVALAQTAVVPAEQRYPVTPAQRSTAAQVAQAGVPLSELSPNAPDSYTVKSGDTLWDISGIFLRSQWRWPELWGMNLDDIKNPHRIYPGQVLYLIKADGRARLATSPGNGEPGTIKVSPRTRYESLADSAVPPISLQSIESFLTEALVVDEDVLNRAPRIVATHEDRVLISRGDRAYARALSADTPEAEPLAVTNARSAGYRVFRNAEPLRDPSTNEILGYEAHYLGKANVIRSETRRDGVNAKGEKITEIVPASLDITVAKEEMRVGDRLLPEPPRTFTNFVPRAPQGPQAGQIVSVYGNAVTYAAQNMVVSINRGSLNGLEPGHVLALLRESNIVPDTTDSAKPNLRLPGERNGLMMVFRTFDRVSYAIVLDIADGVRVGDRFTNP
ncbi:MAG: LysM peptidoglycan-binding domain-containing protein [Hydrogenophaga sp.]|uniref:LysM peptidoglycan-binding domain-containing protein n=1 Tax=Hydrogenophaga sp. TaxID=1904254 RepID=UPI001D292D26|nr:LysM domain-containing protein [Hydrogenophaga sp.]MBX3608402.1 LysM peptidoglycan-binding domain-containing protein [Hydrogenophaga sp.]